MNLSDAKLLVVDDEPALRHLFSKWLASVGCGMVNTAADGEAALSLLRAKAVDLVITDVNMPVMGGVALVRWMAKTSKSLPSIVFVSGFGDVDRREMYSLGVEAFITKPFDHAELLAVLRNSLAERSALWLNAMPVAPKQTMSIRVKEFAGQACQDGICLGRGGFSAVTSCPLSLGKVSFECVFEDGRRELNGQGYVRWNSRAEGVVGIEFAYLHGGCQPWLAKQIAESRPRSFIPGL